MGLIRYLFIAGLYLLGIRLLVKENSEYKKKYQGEHTVYNSIKFVMLVMGVGLLGGLTLVSWNGFVAIGYSLFLLLAAIGFKVRIIINEESITIRKFGKENVFEWKAIRELKICKRRNSYLQFTAYADKLKFDIKGISLDKLTSDIEKYASEHNFSLLKE